MVRVYIAQTVLFFLALPELRKVRDDIASLQGRLLDLVEQREKFIVKAADECFSHRRIAQVAGISQPYVTKIVNRTRSLRNRDVMDNPDPPR